MIVNILRFSFRDDTTEAEREEVLAAMRRTSTSEWAEFGAVGRDVGDPAEGFTHTYLAGVRDLDALERYLYDPVHLRGDDVVIPRLARLVSLRLSDDPAPDLEERIAALHRGKRAKYPEWARQLDAIPDVRLRSGDAAVH
ncbi:Dabb family protein [Streptomyces sp. NPDC059816]|uniref:Dabb family protein n=1 Tax=Streptomyces sp. NPDC059816 TaxID=3346960 RepID=UPI00364FE89B